MLHMLNPGDFDAYTSVVCVLLAVSATVSVSLAVAEVNGAKEATLRSN